MTPTEADFITDPTVLDLMLKGIQIGDWVWVSSAVRGSNFPKRVMDRYGTLFRPVTHRIGKDFYPQLVSQGYICTIEGPPEAEEKCWWLTRGYIKGWIRLEEDK